MSDLTGTQILEIKEAFLQASDVLLGEFYRSEEWNEDYGMTRTYVSKLLSRYGGKHGKAASAWIRSTANWSEVCDRIGVPAAWFP